MPNTQLKQRLNAVLVGWVERLKSANNCTRNAIRWQEDRGALFTPDNVATLSTMIDERLLELADLRQALQNAAHAGGTVAARPGAKLSAKALKELLRPFHPSWDFKYGYPPNFGPWLRDKGYDYIDGGWRLVKHNNV